MFGCLLINEFDRALHCRERDGAEVATGLPELDVLRAELLLAELLKVVAASDVSEEIREGAGPATELPVARRLNTGGEEGEKVRGRGGRERGTLTVIAPRPRESRRQTPRGC